MKPLAPIFFCALLMSGSLADAKPEGKAVAIYTVAPKYGRGLPEGRGWFKLTLDSRGQVLSVAVLKSTGHRVLDASAIAALRQWRFRPVPENYVTMPVEFRQRGKSASMRLDYQ